MNIGFLKEHSRHFIDASRIDLSELEKRDLKLEKRGGDRIYKCLHRNIVRGIWKDYKGFPLKKKFHDQGYLVCCKAIRNIACITAYSDRVVRECLAEMESLGHLIKNNSHTLKGQTVYILGEWKTVKNSKGEDVIKETLLRDTARDEYIKQKGPKPKENDYSMIDYEALYPEGMEAYFSRP